MCNVPDLFTPSIQISPLQMYSKNFSDVWDIGRRTFPVFALDSIDNNTL